MTKKTRHSFYIPVMGTGFTLDTPIHVARYGLSSVVSLVDDVLMETVRRHYCDIYSRPYIPISSAEEDARARRVSAYLDLTDDIVAEQIAAMKTQELIPGTDAFTFFDLLPESSAIKNRFRLFLGMRNSDQKRALEIELLNEIRAGDICANIMTKVDKDNYSGSVPLSAEHSDASSALRGFARSKGKTGLIFSAGLNKRLFSYLEHFDCFFPENEMAPRKEIIIKVSDFRSALLQGRILARRGIWVSEFRIESGMNCGGHAFPTKGQLLGPVLQEFKTERQGLFDELYEVYQKGLIGRQLKAPKHLPGMRITVQGGISTADEHDFLLSYYNLDAAGWGTPFLLVPEATSVDRVMLEQLAKAGEEDVHISNASPLNVGFHNLIESSSEKLRLKRVAANQPGSACPKGYLSFNTEFEGRPLCTASKAYQSRKIAQLEGLNLPMEGFQRAKNDITQKACICHELGNGILDKLGLKRSEHDGTAVCPGPNIAYFNRIYSLAEMVQHIYGRINLFEKKIHASLFATELKLYIQNLRHTIQKAIDGFSISELIQLKQFQGNLIKGIDYYQALMSEMSQLSEAYRERFGSELKSYRLGLEELLSQISSSFPDQPALLAT